MESSGRNGDDAERPAGDGPDSVRLPVERSAEGRFVVRSSSHPPNEQTGGIDVSGVHSRPQSVAPEEAKVGGAVHEVERARPGRSTPAERPRKRKELQQSGAYSANVRARCDTPRALPGTRISDRPGRGSGTSGGSSAEATSLPALAALAAAASTPTAGGDGSRISVDEVTRRVRRPSSVDPPAPAHAQSTALRWRGVVAVGVLVALCLISLWMFG